MKTNSETEHVLKALSALIPEEAQEKVSNTIKAFLENAVKNIEKEYEEKLEEAYSDLKDSKDKDKQIAEEGYAQAWDMICEYKDRLELQREEYNKQLQEGYDQAYQMLEEERKKNDTLESELYEEFEDKLKDIKKFFVNKVHQFLEMQGEKYYEMARKDLVNDPVFAEHKLAFDRILEAAATVLSDEDFAVASSSKVEALVKETEEIRNQMKFLESKNMRLMMENNKLNESVRRNETLLTESKKEDRKNRVEKARKVQGRGASEMERQVVISEYDNSGEPVNQGEDRLVEDVAQGVADYWNFLADVNKEEDEFAEKPKKKKSSR